MSSFDNFFAKRSAMPAMSLFSRLTFGEMRLITFYQSLPSKDQYCSDMSLLKNAASSWLDEHLKQGLQLRRQKSSYTKLPFYSTIALNPYKNWHFTLWRTVTIYWSKLPLWICVKCGFQPQWMEQSTFILTVFMWHRMNEDDLTR